MKKHIFLGAGSTSDPSFKGTYSKEHLQSQGININEKTFIESCHGCPDLMTRYSEGLQELVDNGHQVVSILEGGLSFALPGIQSTQVTFPIISCPLDLIAYQSFIVPPGHAAFGTIGIERKNIDGEYKTTQRKKAISLAEKILNLEKDTVHIIGKNKDKEKLIQELSKFNIETSSDSTLVLNCGSPYPAHENKNCIHMYTDSKENLFRGDYIEESERNLSSLPSTLQVYGIKNLAIYAAKILSLQNPDIREKIKDIKTEKRESYKDGERNIIKEYGGE